jgi:hypothetical protein
MAWVKRVAAMVRRMVMIVRQSVPTAEGYAADLNFFLKSRKEKSGHSV